MTEAEMRALKVGDRVRTGKAQWVGTVTRPADGEPSISVLTDGHRRAYDWWVHDEVTYADRAETGDE